MKLVRRQFLHLAASAAAIPAVSRITWAQNYPTIGTATGIIPADRNFPWNPGMMSVGGIPVRNTIYTTLSPSGGDDTIPILNALRACPVGSVVKLTAGTFLLNRTNSDGNNILIVPNGVVLRGSGAGVTILKKNVGAALPRLGTFVSGTTINQPDDQSKVVGGLENAPIILVGPGKSAGPDITTGSSNLTADGAQGAMSITVANGSLFTVGRFVLLDELAMASWQPAPSGFPNGAPNSVWAGDRVVWNMHNPSIQYQDDTTPGTLTRSGIYALFCRGNPASNWANPNADTDGRATCEIKEIANINGNVITFTSPLTIGYRVSHGAQLTRYSASGSQSTANSIHTTMSGVEGLTVSRSGGGGIFFSCASYSWAKNIEVADCFGLGIAVENSFRVEIRESYVHTSAQPTPAADSYAISLQRGSSEILIENNIMRDYCKVIVARSCGAGSVVAYNYTDDGWDWYGDRGPTINAAYASWVECGINASHCAGPHHVLFEGNYSWNMDSDYTHGNSIYVTAFRNWLSGQRKSFADSPGSARCGGGATYSWWLSYVGNVLGRPGQMGRWTYTNARMGCDPNGNNCVGAEGADWGGQASIWKVGYDPERWPGSTDLKTQTTLIRDGNYDYLTNSQRWHNTPGGFTMPNSMYLTAKPAFFGSNPWPWTDPMTGAIHVLPAKARYDAGTPNSP